MSSVIITMLTGPHAGRSAKFEKGPITYGRSPDNMVVLATDAASRQHGQLEFRDNGKWVVVNHSKNLTTLNGRKVKTEKPLKSGDQVGISSEKFFSVQIEEAAKPEAAAPAPDPAPAAAAATTPMGMAMGMAPGTTPASMGADQVGMQTEEGMDQDQINAQKMARKKKLWIGLAIWIFLVVGFIIVAQAFIGPGNVEEEETKYLTPANIEQIITAEINTSNLVPDIQKMEEHKREAIRFLRRENEPSALYHSYRNFRLAKFHNQNLPLDPQSEIHLETVREQLIKQIQDQYLDAMRAYRSQLDKDARQRFMTLRKMYPDDTSEINQTATTHINIINKRNSNNNNLVP